MVEMFHELRSNLGPINPVVYTEHGDADTLVRVLVRGETLGFRESVSESRGGYLILKREGGAEYAFGAFRTLAGTKSFGVFFLLDPGERSGEAHRMLIEGLNAVLFLEVLNLSSDSTPVPIEEIVRTGEGYPLWI
ncbi:hypothetical protein [Dietzia sp. SYD-A1]|uniref:hypothetical protein n=1 Tax=Dietzia sp. SYD-A1 TaxID=2780141 RepID=UPI0018910A81|nr:hypothetical protein [Dietzia sp. SYD-A1]